MAGGGGGNPSNSVDDGVKSVSGPFSAPAMLALFVSVNMLNYCDRGYLSTTLDTLQIEPPKGLGLSNTETGLLSGSYIFGYVVASMVFSQLMKKHEPFRVACGGLILWVLAVVGCALSPNFYLLALSRAFTGCGEAAYLVCAPPFLDTIAPESSRAKYLGFFFSAIPIGYAVGFVIGGNLIDSNVVGVYWTFRLMFFAEAALMLPFVMFFSAVKSTSFIIDGQPFRFSEHDTEPDPVKMEKNNVVKSSQLLGNPDDLDTDTNGWTNALLSPTEGEFEHVTSDFDLRADTDDSGVSLLLIEPEKTLWENLQELATNLLYVCIVLGYAAQTFTVGGFALYGIQYLVDNFDMTTGNAGFYFGMLTAFCGLVGSASGGWILDEMIATKNAHVVKSIGMGPGINGNKSNASVRAAANELVASDPALGQMIKTEVALRLITIVNTIALPFSISGFLWKNLAVFFISMTLAQFFIFVTLSPINSAIMWVVPFNLTPLAVAMGIVCIHCLGDSISPLMIGVWLDHNDKDWKPVMVTVAAVMIIPCILWVVAWIRAQADLKTRTANFSIRNHMEYEDQRKSELNTSMQYDSVLE